MSFITCFGKRGAGHPGAGHPGVGHPSAGHPGAEHPDAAQRVAAQRIAARARFEDRDGRVDFFRGLALIFIFWDHIPDNPLAQLTLRNIGFSDAAEMFVFLAGYASVLAYGRVYRQSGWLAASTRIWRRAWTLYVVHIFLLAVFMGLVITANNHVQTRDFIKELNLGYFLDNTQQALIDQLLLRFKPNLLDPLPLYIVLLLSLPLLLPGLLKRTRYVVFASLAVYLPATHWGWNFANHDGGSWYFNPFAWQVLFVLGGAVASRNFIVQTLESAQASASSAVFCRRLLLVLAVSYSLGAALLVTLWRWPQWHDVLMPSGLSAWLYPLSKTDLAPARLLHFLALAYCAACLLSRGVWLDAWPAKRLREMGRYSLELFCLGVLLAPLADALNALADDAWWARVATALGGVAVLVSLTAWLEFNRSIQRKQSNQRTASDSTLCTR